MPRAMLDVKLRKCMIQSNFANCHTHYFNWRGGLKSSKALFSFNSSELTLSVYFVLNSTIVVNIPILLLYEDRY